MICPSTFEHGSHQCQYTDPLHADLHKAAPGIRWTDHQADENTEKVAA